MPRRAKVGDIIEIPVARGFAYAQYTHQHPQMGGLIRVFDKLFETRPADLAKIARGAVRFSTFFPLRAAVSRGIFQVIGHQEVAPQNSAFPIFRNGIEDPKTRKVSVWWLWDGEKSWKVGEITPDQRKLPIRE